MWFLTLISLYLIPYIERLFVIFVFIGIVGAGMANSKPIKYLFLWSSGTVGMLLICSVYRFCWALNPDFFIFPFY